MNASKHRAAATIFGVIITVLMFVGMVAMMMGAAPV